ncbi:MAG TPA: winged helix-turn-helix domain-containing protein [Mycobacteriales bacterium]|nr:winged helix-turn-helix domain-containing protein [Mycobacteriales bacterium]
MLRIHFTPDDLARTHVAAGADPMWEAALSFHWLHDRRNPLTFRGWKQEVRGQLPERTRRMLLALNPPTGDFPDFLTPTAGVLGLRAGMEALLATPKAQLRRDLTRQADHRVLPGWCRSVADGRLDAVQAVADAVSEWHDVALAPYWERISARLTVDLAVRARALRLGGVDRLLASLPAPLRWQPPVLETPYPDDRDLHLGGRGLMLLPAFFCLWFPVTLIDPHLPPVLVYPVESDLEWLGPGGEPDTMPFRTLAALIGETRAAVLCALAGSALTTGELARQLHLSPSSASEHVTVLRNAGLAVTHRDGVHALHLLTRLGIQLLERRA